MTNQIDTEIEAVDDVRQVQLSTRTLVSISEALRRQIVAARDARDRLLVLGVKKTDRAEQWVAEVERIAREFLDAADVATEPPPVAPTVIWTLRHERLAQLRQDLEGGHTLRVAVDGGDLKYKVNEDMWTPGIEPDQQ